MDTQEQVARQKQLECSHIRATGLDGVENVIRRVGSVPVICLECFQDALTRTAEAERQEERERTKRQIQSTVDHWRALVNSAFTAEQFRAMQSLIDHAFQEGSTICHPAPSSPSAPPR